MPAYEVETPPVGIAAESPDYGGEYALETQHVEKSIEALISFFRQGPRNRSLLRALAAQVQELEDVAWELKSEDFIDTATGHRLDLIGLIVGEGRSDRDDAAYRNALRIRSLVNRSNGRLTEIVTVLALLLPGEDIFVGEVYPAALKVDIEDLGTVSGELVGQILRQMKAGGVALDASVSYGGGLAVGAVDGDPLGGTLGAVDGDPAGFTIGGVL